jgi:DNA-binding NarL/FixJ family response regulator
VAALLRVIIVDDDATVLRSFKRALAVRRPTWVVTTLHGFKEAIQYLAENECDVFVTDYEMPELNGIELLTKVRDQWPAVRRVILSGKPADLVDFAPQHLVQAWVRKAWGADELIAVVEDLVAAPTAQEHQRIV